MVPDGSAERLSKVRPGCAITSEVKDFDFGGSYVLRSAAAPAMGVQRIDTMFAPAGQGAEKGVQVPGTRQYRNAQFMTPETRSTTHFLWNYLHDFDLDNPNIALSLRTVSKKPSTRTSRSSRRSRRCSTPIRTISCSPSVRMQH
jgi:Vanillate O-demethylase oxygenase C-terminal domain